MTGSYIVNLLNSLLAGFRGATALELKLHAHNLFFPPDYEDLPRLPSLKFSPLAPALTLVIAVSSRRCGWEAGESRGPPNPPEGSGRRPGKSGVEMSVW